MGAKGGVPLKSIDDNDDDDVDDDLEDLSIKIRAVCQ